MVSPLGAARLRPSWRSLALVLALVSAFLLTACGGDAATPTPVPVATNTAIPVSPEQALLDQYQGLLNSQDWAGAAALFASSADDATRAKFVADMTQFVADNGLPTQVLVENVTNAGDKVTATVKVRTVSTQLTQQVTLVQENGNWRIESITTS